MQRVIHIKGHQIVVYQLVKIGGSWTQSVIRGSMDPAHERGSMDQGSMFCFENEQSHNQQ